VKGAPKKKAKRAMKRPSLDRKVKRPDLNRGKQSAAAREEVVQSDIEKVRAFIVAKAVGGLNDVEIVAGLQEELHYTMARRTVFDYRLSLAQEIAKTAMQEFERALAAHPGGQAAHRIHRYGELYDTLDMMTFKDDRATVAAFEVQRKLLHSMGEEMDNQFQIFVKYGMAAKEGTGLPATKEELEKYMERLKALGKRIDKLDLVAIRARLEGRDAAIPVSSTVSRPSIRGDGMEPRQDADARSPAPALPARVAAGQPPTNQGPPPGRATGAPNPPANAAHTVPAGPRAPTASVVPGSPQTSPPAASPTKMTPAKPAGGTIPQKGPTGSSKPGGAA
jgi:hypothetical protein